MSQLNTTNPNFSDEKETKAIELKYEGKEYADIEKEVGVPIATLKDWFRREGRLRPEYEEYTQEQNELRKDEAGKIVKQNIHNAAKVLVDLLTSGDDKTKLRAATELLDRELGPPAKHIEVSSDNQYGTKLKSMTKEELIRETEMTLQQVKNESVNSITTIS